MAKRFTDTNKWRDPWFRSLAEGRKLFWMYLLDNCNHAGIWDVDKQLAEFDLWQGVADDPEVFGDRVMVLREDRWFIPKFITFQYGALRENNSTHISVINILKNYGINWKDITDGRQAAHKQLPSSYQGAKGTDKDIDTDKDKDRSRSFSTPEFDDFWNVYPKKSGKIAAFKEFEKFKLADNIEQVLVAAKKYKSKTQEKYWLDPVRWINRGHWMDEAPKQQSGEDAAARTKWWLERTGGAK